MAAVIDPTTALERSYEELAKVVADLRPDDLARPTCCPDWDVRALLNHTLGSAQMFTAANEGRLVAEDAGDVVGDDPGLAVAATTAAANIASWRRPGGLEGDRTYPFGTFPAAAGLATNVGEISLHAWDIARASGRPGHLDAEVATIVLDFYRQIPMDDMRAHGVYGPEIAVPETASVQDRLLGFLGREQ